MTEATDAPSRPWTTHYPPGIEWDVPIDTTPVHEQVLAACAKTPDADALDFLGNKTRFRELASAMAAACESAGRDRATLRTTVGFRISVDESSADATRIVQGGADAVATAIDAWEAEGVDELVCWPEPSTRGLE